nr:AraC family transcriptional regulator ligand-binding domain-containing protein [Oceanococcus sp. HetDA_MAG_MS8]
MSQFATSLSYFRPGLDYLRRHQQPLEPYLEVLGISSEQLHQADIRIPNSRARQFLQLAEQQLNEPYIGLHMGESMQWHHLGILGLLLVNCREVKEVFELQTRYQSLVGNGLETAYLPEPEGICLRVQPPAGHPALSRQEYEYSLAGWWQLKTSLLGPELRPTKVELPYAAPSDIAPLVALFGVRPSFDASAVRIYFAANYAHLALQAADPQLKHMLELQAQKRLQDLRGQVIEQDPQLAKLRAFLVERLAFGTPSLEQAAQELGVAVRTLQRRLDSRRTSYSQLLDQVRQQQAQSYIKNADMSLLDVAMMLGFAEQSSFARAFKRWFGKAPGVYRRELS